MEYPLFAAASSQPAYSQFGELPPYTASIMDESKISSPENVDPSAAFFDYNNYPFDEAQNVNLQHPSGASPVLGASVDSGIGMDMERSNSLSAPTPGADPSLSGRRRSSSEEKEAAGLTPAQTRRKAQNRAAQRAFRERKERHVKDLENKLSALEAASHSLQSDNERLKLALQRAETENEILRATTATNPNSLPPSPTTREKVADAVNGPQHFTPGNTFVTLDGASLSRNGGGVPASQNGQAEDASLLPVSATWDVIMAHPLFKQGKVDIGDVCDRLKRLATCVGHGPVFKESDVIRVVEGARRGGGDELI